MALRGSREAVKKKYKVAVVFEVEAQTAQGAEKIVTDEVGKLAFLPWYFIWTNPIPRDGSEGETE